MFYPIKPPSHAIAQQPPKPLIEFAMIKQSTSVDGEQEQSVLDHYKYVKALVGAFVMVYVFRAIDDGIQEEGPRI